MFSDLGKNSLYIFASWGIFWLILLGMGFVFFYQRYSAQKHYRKLAKTAETP